ncbi:MAG: hypothetical protein FVQ80_11450 [Planctomycetes bacterium]|nr:hypothetical protein [Planctomycetota bacterium]
MLFNELFTNLNAWTYDINYFRQGSSRVEFWGGALAYCVYTGLTLVQGATYFLDFNKSGALGSGICGILLCAATTDDIGKINIHLLGPGQYSYEIIAGNYSNAFRLYVSGPPGKLLELFEIALYEAILDETDHEVTFEGPTSNAQLSHNTVNGTRLVSSVSRDAQLVSSSKIHKL